MHKYSVPLLAIFSALAMGQEDCNQAPVDEDQDGYSVEDGDCNDAEATINPGATELCNGIDEDCDGIIDNDTCNGSIALDFRYSAIEIYGEDNGRDENEYEDSASTDDLEGFEVRLADSIEYVESASSQLSFVEQDAFVAQLFASASGQDDYGYGDAYSRGRSEFYVGFTLEEASWLNFNATVNVQEGWDGGSGSASIVLLLGRTELMRIEGDSIVEQRLLLEPGSYQLQAETHASASLSGGGDAYPSGSATLELSAQFAQ